ncbi:MAG TPA: phosphatase PAP2 family protein [Acetobacteraceae bacterium]|nr:phosphatase PAP2 family protein [Acetobacteraceae bacterium]
MGFGWFLPDRVDLPFVTLLDSTGEPIKKNRFPLAEFPQRNWSAEWYAWLALGEYVEKAGWTGVAPPKWDDNKTPGELDDLATAAQDERPDALGEILAQADEFISYFLELLTITPTSHPATVRLLNIANLIALFSVMYCKGTFKRPRPSQLCPALAPPIPVPGHSSFPSGHATQSMLMAFCLIDVLPVVPRGGLHPAANLWEQDLTVLAHRIARNREIAGLHYPSDSDAGRKLAENIHTQLGTLPNIAIPIPPTLPDPLPYYKYALAKAKEEWP